MQKIRVSYFIILLQFSGLLCALSSLVLPLAIPRPIYAQREYSTHFSAGKCAGTLKM